MSSLNNCNFIGHLGGDPEIRYTQEGKSIARLSIACSEKWKDKQTGEMKENTEWVRVVAFGRLAEVMGEYLKKGSKVFISGRMKTSKYTDKNGIEKYSTDIVAEKMLMLDSKGQGQGQGKEQAPPQQVHQTQVDDDLNDDIPF